MIVYVLAIFAMGFMWGVGVAHFLTNKKLQDLIAANVFVLKSLKDILDSSEEDHELMRKILEELNRYVESQQSHF